jgi:hypothetical protein
MTSVAFAGLRIEPAGSLRVEDEQTIGGADVPGLAQLFEVSDGLELRLTLRDCTFENGERDVTVVDRHGSPAYADVLVRRLRLGVEPHAGGRLRAACKQARLKPTGHANLHWATPEDVLAPLGPYGADLYRAGVELGTREDLLGDEGRLRTKAVAVFDARRELAPVLLHVVTRVLPVRQGLTA